MDALLVWNLKPTDNSVEVCDFRNTLLLLSYFYRDEMQRLEEEKSETEEAYFG